MLDLQQLAVVDAWATHSDYCDLKCSKAADVSSTAVSLRVFDHFCGCVQSRCATF